MTKHIESEKTKYRIVFGWPKGRYSYFHVSDYKVALDSYKEKIRDGYKAKLLKVTERIETEELEV